MEHASYIIGPALKITFNVFILAELNKWFGRVSTTS